MSKVKKPTSRERELKRILLVFGGDIGIPNRDNLKKTINKILQWHRKHSRLDSARLARERVEELVKKVDYYFRDYIAGVQLTEEDYEDILNELKSHSIPRRCFR